MRAGQVIEARPNRKKTDAYRFVQCAHRKPLLQRRAECKKAKTGVRFPNETNGFIGELRMYFEAGRWRINTANLEIWVGNGKSASAGTERLKCCAQEKYRKARPSGLLAQRFNQIRSGSALEIAAVESTENNNRKAIGGNHFRARIRFAHLWDLSPLYQMVEV